MVIVVSLEEVMNPPIGIGRSVGPEINVASRT
jgi:hypothetical protein